VKTKTEFVHLHVHSDYSIMDSSATVRALVDRAEELGMKYLALTDHANMFGVMEFFQTCKEQGKTVRPIIGCEVYVTPGSRFEKVGTESENKYHHLVLLAENREGYFNLIKLCSLAYTEGFHHRPRVDDELLKQYHKGLIALSGCAQGEIPQLILEGKTKDAQEKARYYRNLFGGNNFYLEIQNQGITAEALKGGLSQQELNKTIADISNSAGIPIVATNDVHYLMQEDAAAHEVLGCIRQAKLLDDTNRTRFYGDQFYLKSGEEMASLFPEYPEAIANTVRIAERCVADIPIVPDHELHQHLPEVEIPLGFATADDYFRHLATAGLANRYPAEKEASGDAWKEIQDRLEYELDVIITRGFTNYFLIVADYVNWARNNDIPVGPGRGSGAGSIVAYALQITSIDPIKYDLLFERFLNPERTSVPDFDIDFGDAGRDEVINYVTEKYGRDRVGQIIMFGTFGARAVIKDVAQTLGIPINEMENLAGLISAKPWMTLKKAFANEPRLRELEENPNYTDLFTFARKLEGLKCRQELHACGLVIGKSELNNIVPVFIDPNTGDIATQFSYRHLEDCGLIKMDFLGLRTLDVVKHTERLIRNRGGEYANFDVESIPEDDKATFKMLGEGESLGVFQFESNGMKDILRQAKPDTMTDLIALNTLIRPAQMENIPQFIESKNGKREIVYPDPCLEDILKETYGVIMYREQVMRIIQRIAGYSLGMADILRRTMSREDKETVAREKISFLEGAVKQGFFADKTGDIFDMLIPFASFNFDKSHSAAYTKLAYQTAYLKANFPSEFMAAI